MVEDVLPIDIQYLLPVFEKAAVTLQSGEEQTGRINIHTPTQKVHMLDEKGDTMMVAGQEDIVRIQTRDCTIIPADTCWVTVITEHGGITLSSLASIELEYPDGTFTLRCIYKTEFVLTSEGRMYPCRLQSFLKLFRKRRNRSAGSPRPTTPTSTNWNPSCSCSTSAQESKNVSGHFHNGTISRYSLPLRHRVFEATASTGHVGHIQSTDHFHNGTVSRYSLPLRKLMDFPLPHSFGRSNVCPSSELARRTLTTS